MSKKAIENLIPKAMEALSETFPDGTFPSSYNGYISSFGASVMQSGLKPTLALFENQDANTKEKKQLLTSVILKVLDKNSSESTLLDYVLKSKNDEVYLKQKILNISIAVKLCLRTFKKGD
jgi:CRISPR-associated protein Cmr5